MAKESEGLNLFGMWCPTLGGGPPTTGLHIFDYPFEESEDNLRLVLSDYGDFKKCKFQTYLSNSSIYTGTRLVTMVLDTPPPPDKSQ